MELKPDKITSSPMLCFMWTTERLREQLIRDEVTILAVAKLKMALIIKHIMLKFNRILYGGYYSNASLLTAKNRQNRQKTDALFPGKKNKIIEKRKKKEEKGSFFMKNMPRNYFMK